MKGHNVHAPIVVGNWRSSYIMPQMVFDLRWKSDTGATAVQSTFARGA
jgi:hypothetical protein